jgi:hypothetical protein
VPLGPLRRLGLAPVGLLASSLGLAPLGLLASSLGLAPLGLLASSLGLASLGLRLNPLSSADRLTRRFVSVAGRHRRRCVGLVEGPEIRSVSISTSESRSGPSAAGSP